MSRQFKIVEHATLKFNRFLGTSKALILAVAIILLWGWSRASDSKWHELIVEAAAMAIKDDPSRLTISLDKADDIMKELHRDLIESDQIDMRPPQD